MKLKVKSPIKWAGGKTQLLDQFDELLPLNFSTYIEPFVGGGALFFHLLPSDAILIDLNTELINFYTVVRDDVENLIESLKVHKNQSDYYYKMRDLDPSKLSPLDRASRFLYLNKTSYNGLWRTNKKGIFNVPFGRHKNVRLFDEENIRRVSLALKNIKIISGDFTIALQYAKNGDFIYMDPPYYPLSKTSNFTSYSGTFNEKDQIRLSECFRELDRIGAFVMLSNSNTDFVRSLYKGYDIRVVRATRRINSKVNGRGTIDEVVIRNFS
ncbi:DNA adenine methylase [Athalassotoga saccharophila]|uniref:DNA adenine methylase n=1 Tax=Athalassotoga saccharophila TaxID=1441386 RepID=UPI0038CC016B